MLVISHILNGVAAVLDGFLWIYLLILFARAITSWVSASPRNPIVAFLYMVTEPPIRAIRRKLPANLRYFPLDIAFLVLLALVLFANNGIVPLMKDYALQMRHSALSEPTSPNEIY